MIHRFMPIGREGYDIPEVIALSAVADRLISRCDQCSHGDVIIYHDYFG